MMNLFLAGLGGFLGSALRYWISTNTYRVTGQAFPYGTMVVNVTGCFFIGFLMNFFEQRFMASPGLRIFLTIGILGGFTTFSTFSFETMALIQEGSFWLAGCNIFLSLFLCLGSTWLGLATGKLV